LLQLAALPAEAVLERTHSHPDGLTLREARERLKRHGPNAVAAGNPFRPLRRLLALFTAPLVLLLLALAAVNYLIGETKGAAVIAFIVALSTLLSYAQELRSGRAAERLRALVHTTTSVLRRSGPNLPPRIMEVPLAQLVSGDLVHLSAGDLVPADLRLLAAKDLFVNQAALTGESLPAEKFAHAIAAPSSALGCENLAFMGSHVVTGTATAIVIHTGARSQFGLLAASLAEARPATSFDRGVRGFTLMMLRFMLVMAPLVFVVNGMTKGNWLEAFLFAVAIAVGLAPEMLPMIVTINLAQGAIAMARRQVIVKRLEAIQEFGAMDVLCTDKTGTLTQDRVILERYVDALGAEAARVLDLAYLNSHYQTGLRNLLDVAVLEHREVAARLAPEQNYRKIDEIPFDFERRRMSVVVSRTAGKDLLICKGAVAEVLAVCREAEGAGGRFPLETSHHDELKSVAAELNGSGFRVIAVACKELPATARAYAVADERDLVLAGYVAFLDPPKDSAAAAIRALCDRGIAVKVLTGDSDAVAVHVCRSVGVNVEAVVLGEQIERLSDLDLAAAAEEASLFARLSPAQKARVIAALRGQGHVVGFLGDGINDGPALRAADVGISVDTAVDAAKDSADIILMEKSLLVLEAGVAEGRRVFGNIVKYLKMGASSNFGNMISMLGASAILPFLPMAPVQVLFNNLLYDLSQAAVTTDEVDAEYLRTPRRWEIDHVARYMLGIGPLSSVFDFVTFAVLAWGFGALANPALFQSGWFVESLLSQTLVVHVLRTGRIPFRESRPSTALLSATVAICGIGAWLPFSPLAPVLDLVPLPASYGLALFGIIAAYLVLVQFAKGKLVKRFGLD